MSICSDSMETNSQCFTTLHTLWLEMFACYTVSVCICVFFVFFWSIFLLCCWIKILWLCQCLSKCSKWDIKGIINSKKQFFMQNENLTSFWSTQTLLDLFLKSHNLFSGENCKNWMEKNVNFFTNISFVFTKKTVIRKYL